MDNSIQILIADDHPVLLEGVVSIIKKQFTNAIIHTANNGAVALHKILESEPDIAILDIEMPILNGIEVVKKINQTSITTKIIFLTLHKERTFFDEVRDLNISGYVLKEFSIDQITTCIEKVIKGETFFSSEIERFLTKKASCELPKFTKTELNIIKLIAVGKTTKEIAEMLFVSTKTIDSHRYNLVKKLNLKPEKNNLLKWVLQNSSKI